MENIETKWVNLYSGAVPEYLYVSGYCFGGGQTAPDEYRQQWRESLTNFHGLAAVAIREVECQCGRKARWLHIEGLIPGVTGAVPNIHLHSGSRGTLSENEDGDFYMSSVLGPVGAQGS